MSDFDEKTTTYLLRELVEKIKELNEMLRNGIETDIKRCKQNYKEAIKIAGELHASL